MDIFFDDRSYKKTNRWKSWVIQVGKDEYVKIAGARELANGYKYEMYCRQSKYSLDRSEIKNFETYDKDRFAKWFEAHFKRNPFDTNLFPGSGEYNHKFKQVKPEFFSGNYTGLWKDTPKLFQIISNLNK